MSTHKLFPIYAEVQSLIDGTLSNFQSQQSIFERASYETRHVAFYFGLSGSSDG